MTQTTLIVPGLHNSGSDHWQTWFETEIPNTVRVIQEDWESPIIKIWAKRVEDHIRLSEAPVFIVAHSFGVIASIMGAASVADNVSGALFVAPADPSRFKPDGERINQDSSELNTGLFNYIPKEPLGYPSILAASTNDYCMPFKRTAWWAKTWGSRLVSLGNAGHVNAASGFGQWPEGLALYKELVTNAIFENKNFNINMKYAYL
jgi:predicted alpha/beta hydrolase family esterase